MGRLTKGLAPLLAPCDRAGMRLSYSAGRPSGCLGDSGSAGSVGCALEYAGCEGSREHRADDATTSTTSGSSSNSSSSSGTTSAAHSRIFFGYCIRTLGSPLAPPLLGSRSFLKARLSYHATSATAAHDMSAAATNLSAECSREAAGSAVEPIMATAAAEAAAVEARRCLVHGGSSTMRAAVQYAVNEAMRVELLHIPQPQAGEVLLKIRSCGVCHTDLHVIKGEIPFVLPCVLGHEVSGEVVDHGMGTDAATRHRLPVGARVVASFIMPCGSCFFCTQGLENVCETFFSYNRQKGVLYDGTTRLFRASDGKPIHMYSMGGLAEYAVVPATAVAPLPPSLPALESAIVGCALFTAYGALRNAADLRAGQSVAVIGAGGVGMSCVQVARAFGATQVIAVDIVDSKLDSCQQLGATHCVNAAQMDTAATIRELTGGRGVDVAVEALGRAQTLEAAVGSVRDGGHAVAVGIAPVGATAAIPITHLVRRNIRLSGSFGARPQKDLPTILRMADARQLDVAAAVTTRCPLEEAAVAYDALGKGEITGRAVVDMEL